MAGPRALDMAAALSRRTAFASTMARAPVPVDALDVIRVAAAEPDACHRAAAQLGVPEPDVVAIARAYVTNVLFRSDADCYRVLGLVPGASRDDARIHMRLLLQWLHPDRNATWEATYARRVVNAWREIANPELDPPAAPVVNEERTIRPVSLPWISTPRVARRRSKARLLVRGAVAVVLMASLLQAASLMFDTKFELSTILDTVW